jgi:hypothetical protein
METSTSEDRAHPAADAGPGAPSSADPATTGTAGSRWYGVLLGLLATGAGLAAAEMVTGLVRDTASPVVPVGQVFIDWVPPGVKDWAIQLFGTADKAVLVSGALIIILGLGVLIGMLAIRGERAAAYAACRCSSCGGCRPSRAPTRPAGPC